MDDPASIVNEDQEVKGDVIVAVMGLTGVGKSNFISLLGAQHVRTQESTIVGSSLASGKNS
jgi:ABC-type lipoprotein export system ATPase subunit